MRSLFKVIYLCINVCIGLGLIISVGTSLLDAREYPRLVIAAMTVPFWVIVSIILLFANFFIYRKATLWMAICLSFALPLAFTVMPLNIKRGEVPEELKKSEWTLLSYNICNFADITETFADDLNPGMSYILATDADVVVLPEGEYFFPLPMYHIRQPQLDSIRERYPYHFIGRDISLFSKFPAREIPLDSFPNQLYKRSSAHSKAAAYMVDINGEETAIFGLHLKSLGLTRDDKDLYEDFTRGQAFTSALEIKEAEDDIISKIAAANRERASQILALIDEIRRIDCKNVIVCGDFNDTPGCYSLRELEETGLREVYPLVGNGYMYTYNSDRLLFQIDHVLFKGDMRPWTMKRGNLRSSDHYPLLTTFVTDDRR